MGTANTDEAARCSERTPREVLPWAGRGCQPSLGSGRASWTRAPRAPRRARYSCWSRPARGAGRSREVSAGALQVGLGQRPLISRSVPRSAPLQRWQVASGCPARSAKAWQLRAKSRSRCGLQGELGRVCARLACCERVRQLGELCFQFGGRVLGAAGGECLFEQLGDGAAEAERARGGVRGQRLFERFGEARVEDGAHRQRMLALPLAPPRPGAFAPCPAHARSRKRARSAPDAGIRFPSRGRENPVLEPFSGYFGPSGGHPKGGVVNRRSRMHCDPGYGR